MNKKCGHVDSDKDQFTVLKRCNCGETTSMKPEQYFDEVLKPILVYPMNIEQNKIMLDVVQTFLRSILVDYRKDYDEIVKIESLLQDRLGIKNKTEGGIPS